MEEGHDSVAEDGCHLCGDAEPAGEIGFEGFLVEVAEVVLLAGLGHDFTLVFGVEVEVVLVEHFLDGDVPFLAAVSVVVHL